MKPMLAGSPESLEDIKFPVLASPKLDGVRCLVIDGKLMTRSLKPIPNQAIQELFAGLPDGLDGELIVGDPWDDPYRRTVSLVMSEDGNTHGIGYYVFDSFEFSGGFGARYAALEIGHPHCHIVMHQLFYDVDGLRNYAAQCVKSGYEGAMVRSPNGPYKHGRSTVKEGYLLKIKEFCDAEAVIIGFEERMHNANVAKKNALGRTERSSHKENLIGRKDLGALVVRDIKTEVEFKIGTGFDDETRQAIWQGRRGYVGKIVKYTYFPTGSKDRPRFPVFAGFRDSRDM